MTRYVCYRTEPSGVPRQARPMNTWTNAAFEATYLGRPFTWVDGRRPAVVYVDPPVTSTVTPAMLASHTE